MDNINPYLDLFHKVIDTINNHDIPYVLVGGAVVPYYGNIRTTQDIDIMLLLDDIDDDRLENWLTDLKADGLSLDVDEIKYAMDQKIHGTIFETTSYTFRVDLKRIHTQLDRLTYKYKKMATIHNREVLICSAESLIGVKSSKGYRSNTDLEDILAIIEINEINHTIVAEFLSTTGSKGFVCNFLQVQQTPKTLQLAQFLNC